MVSTGRPGLKYPSNMAVLTSPCNLERSHEGAAEGESCTGALALRRSEAGVRTWKVDAETHDSHECIKDMGKSDK